MFVAVIRPHANCLPQLPKFPAVPQRPVRNSAEKDAKDTTTASAAASSVDDLLNSMPSTPVKVPSKSEVPFDFEVSESDQLQPQNSADSGSLAQNASDPLTRLVREDSVSDESIQPIDDSPVEPVPRTRRAKLPTSEEQSHVIAASATAEEAPTITDAIVPESLPPVPTRPFLRSGSSVSTTTDDQSDPKLANRQSYDDSSEISGNSFADTNSNGGGSTENSAVVASGSKDHVDISPEEGSEPLSKVYTNSDALSTNSQVSVISDVRVDSMPSVPARPIRPCKSPVNKSERVGGSQYITENSSENSATAQDIMTESPSLGLGKNEKVATNLEETEGPVNGDFETSEDLASNLETAKSISSTSEKSENILVQSSGVYESPAVSHLNQSQGSAYTVDESENLPATTEQESSPVESASGSSLSGKQNVISSEVVASDRSPLDVTDTELPSDISHVTPADLQQEDKKDTKEDSEQISATVGEESQSTQANPAEDESDTMKPSDDISTGLNKTQDSEDLQSVSKPNPAEPTDTNVPLSAPAVGAEETKFPGKETDDSSSDQSTKSSETGKPDAKEITPPPIVPRRPASRGNSGLDLPRVPTHRPQADSGSAMVSKVLPSVPTRPPVKGETGLGKAAPSVPARPNKLSSFEPTNDAPPKLKPKPVINSKIGALRASLFSDLNSALARGAPPARGVAGAGLGIPPAQGPSIGTTAKHEETVEGKKEPEAAVTDARRSRARGPRGRRLPTEAKSEWTFAVAEVWSLQSVADEVISRNASEAVQSSAGIENVDHHNANTAEQTENLPHEESAPEPEIEREESSAEPESTPKEVAEKPAKDSVVLPRLDTNYNLMSDISLSTPVEVGLPQNDSDNELQSNAENKENQSSAPTKEDEETSFTILGDISAAPTPILQQKEWEA